MVDLPLALYRQFVIEEPIRLQPHDPKSFSATC
jgi:hypothetical protein